MIMDFIAIYVMWLREMKRFFRATSQIIGTLMMPLMFLLGLGFGFGSMSVSGFGEGTNYLAFLVPGIIGMGLMTRSVMGGVSVLWDRQFGFLKEIMVAPVSRTSIVLGRMAGGVTTALLQGVLILLVSIPLGFNAGSLFQVLLSLGVMLLISSAFIGLGLIIASRMKDMQGFNLIMNFLILPMYFLSGAFYPINNLPTFIRIVSYIDPLTYGVDALRGIFLGASSMPMVVDVTVLALVSVFFVVLGAYSFDKSESV